MSEMEKYIETKVSIEYEQQTGETIIIESEDKTNGNIIIKIFDAIKNYKNVRSIKSKKYSSKSVLSHDDDIISEKEDFQIAISQSGRFVATFDTANLRIKILENTDHRPLSIPKVEDMDSNKSDIIDKTIVHFKIRDLNIDKFYTEGFTSSLYKESREQKNVDITVDISNDNDSFNNFEKDEVIEDEKFRCSFDISNVCMNNNKHFIFDAVSCIDDEDLRGTTKETNEKRGTTIIYPIKLLKDEKENYIILVELEFQKFVILNFHGSLGSSEISGYMDILLSCVYDKYFLVEQYKNNVQLLEGYTFLKNGLESISKKFDDIENTYSLVFIEKDRKFVIDSGAEDEENLKLIIWDMYNAVETETIELDDFLTT
uniref:Uncharacterized protein n=1 Tax=Rhizophagus irregularis (strain DAOM 181602 / DAOM 197198 / MUCL 43194) TaxID=747089 RepID=U9SGA0_RHIID